MTFVNYQWQIPTTDITLFNQEIHLWLVYLNNPNLPLEQLTNILSSDEIHRAHRFHFEKDRNKFIICRGILRQILGSYLQILPQKLQFNYSDRGKPFLTEKINFNLSHSQDLALYAMTSDRRVGVDVEYIRDIQVEEIAKRFFCVQEHDIISRLPENQKQAAFFKGWTSKEAYLKAIGQGLAESLDQIEVTLAPNAPSQIVSIAGDTKAAKLWSLYQLNVNSNYAAALAVEANNYQLKCWQLPENLNF